MRRPRVRAPVFPVAQRIVRSFLAGLATFVLCGFPVLAGGARDEARPQGTRRPAAAGAASFEENDPSVTWSGSWSPNGLAANSGGAARLAMDAGAQASFAFTGTDVSWIGYRDEWCGIAKVVLDGEPQAGFEARIGVDLWFAGRAPTLEAAKGKDAKLTYQGGLFVESRSDSINDR